MDKLETVRISAKIVKKMLSKISSLKVIADVAEGKVRGVNPKFANILRNYVRRDANLVVNKDVDLNDPASWLAPDIFEIPTGHTKKEVIESGKKAFLRALAGYFSGVLQVSLDGKTTKKGIKVKIPMQGKAHQEAADGAGGYVRRPVWALYKGLEMQIGGIKVFPGLTNKGGAGKVVFNFDGISPLEFNFSDFGNIEKGWDLSSDQLKEILNAVQKSFDFIEKNKKQITVESPDYD